MHVNYFFKKLFTCDCCCQHLHSHISATNSNFLALLNQRILPFSMKSESDSTISPLDVRLSQSYTLHVTMKLFHVTKILTCIDRHLHLRSTTSTSTIHHFRKPIDFYPIQYLIIILKVLPTVQVQSRPVISPEPNCKLSDSFPITDCTSLEIFCV